MSIISILICTRNRHTKLSRCLHSILSTNIGSQYEIIVVDQSDQPLPQETIESLGNEHLQYVWSKGRGLAKARNTAVRMAKGDVLAFTDDDCVVAPEWLTLALDTFRQVPTALGVFGRVLAYSEPTEQISHHIKQSKFGNVTYATKPGPMFCNALCGKLEQEIFDKPCLPFENLGSGNNMFFRREVFEKYGLFVEYLGTGSWMMSAEDTEFHYRLLRRGCKLVYNSDILIYHDNWITLEQNAHVQNGYTCGVVAVFLYFGLLGDKLSWDFLRYRWEGVTEEIAAYSRGAIYSKALHYWMVKRLAFLRGILGGLWLVLAPSAHPLLK